MATVGYTSIGANTFGAGSGTGTNNPAGLLVTMPVAGSILKITAYVFMSSTTRSTVCRLYTGSANSRGTLQANTVSTSITSTPGWVDFIFTSPFSASATTYWIDFAGYGGDGPSTSTANIKYDTGGTTNGGYQTLDNGTLVYDSNNYSIYATYTTQGTFTNITSIANIQTLTI